MAKGAKQKTHKASAKVLTKKKNGTITYKKGNAFITHRVVAVQEEKGERL